MALTPKQLEVLRSTPFHGFEPGSNLWHEVEYEGVAAMFGGEDVQPLVRDGFLEAVRSDQPLTVSGKHPELEGVVARFRYFRTPKGDAALTELQ